MTESGHQQVCTLCLCGLAQAKWEMGRGIALGGGQGGWQSLLACFRLVIMADVLGGRGSKVRVACFVSLSGSNSLIDQPAEEG